MKQDTQRPPGLGAEAQAAPAATTGALYAGTIGAPRPRTDLRCAGGHARALLPTSQGLSKSRPGVSCRN